MSVNKTAAGLTLAASLLIGAAAGAQEPGITDKAIKIGIFGPLSGPNMAYGFDVVNAAKMYYDKINKEGGIHGRKIEYVVEDDRCNANDLVAAVKKLVEQENVFMLNGGSCSAAVVAAKDYVVRNKVPYLMLNASGDGALFPPTDYIFGAYSISQYAVGGAMVEFAAKQFGAKNVAYINHDDAYGAWNLEGSKKDAEVNGVKLSVESINPGINDVTAPFLKVRAANPDAILLVTYARPAALLIKKAAEMGFNKPIILSVTGTASLNQLAENVGKDALKNFYTQEVMIDSPGGAKLKPIYDMYKAAYPELAAKPDHPQTYMPYGIPPAMSLVKALQDAGPNPTREKVLAALKTQDFDSGVMAGRMQFGPEQRAANRSTIFIKYDGTTMAPLPGVFTSRWTYQAK
ncbi:branched-chain amino acid transport system substrate-binding protein [Bosea sp. BE271]|jgi:branched-chain amino acid transport system substrate-binding protein|uniref:ABC transporter substrate-binding protein n=1 Tax=Bosea TaxID=85413 RepID=UPI00286326BD|nr:MULTISPECIES: ABC transporter substrate-binding protein [Bosea]MDR6827220.1 branched-chain amino acid transport system substrate-binding protein [Bosea robiniae]MDR6893930.1 branched-chain amino acid transport system substrate-binding protein [Bosea sp. BE109]MDR7137325.1 branched-chain amino acid transport system substrate-binding protein [Bosea sp. BE168]MDR7174025.1 branched-chain amino acid transport system substrate-binding protein [Bosea sp. BE271]